MNRPTDEGDEIVNVPVPKRHLAAVYQTLADVMSSADPMSLAQSTPLGDPMLMPITSSVDGTIDWTDTANWQRLWKGGLYPSIPTLLELTASKPGEIVTFEQFIKAAGLERSQVQSELGAFTKKIKRVFDVDKEHARWPVDFYWDNTAGADSRACYSMQPEVAKAYYATKP